MKILVARTSVVGKCRRCGLVVHAWTYAELRARSGWHDRPDSPNSTRPLSCVAQNSEIIVSPGQFIYDADRLPTAPSW